MKVDAAYAVFANLPNIASLPQPENPTSDTIGIIPVFKDPYFNEHNSIAYLWAAIYSRQTFLLHSDATATQTAVKFYMETSLRSEALPILEQNCLDSQRDVIWFDAPPLPDTFKGIWARLGKKSRLFWDPQFSAYEKVVYWDADIFHLNVAGSLFKTAKGLTEDLYAIRTVTHPRRIWRPHAIRKITKSVFRGILPIQDIFERAGLGRVLQNVGGDRTRGIGSVGVYPAAALHTHHPAFIDYLREHAPYIGDDEICLMLAAALFDLRTFSLEPHFTMERFANLTRETKHTFLHGTCMPDEVGRYKDLLKNIVS